MAEKHTHAQYREMLDVPCRAAASPTYFRVRERERRRGRERDIRRRERQIENDCQSAVWGVAKSQGLVGGFLTMGLLSLLKPILFAVITELVKEMLVRILHELDSSEAKGGELRHD